MKPPERHFVLPVLNLSDDGDVPEGCPIQTQTAYELAMVEINKCLRYLNEIYATIDRHLAITPDAYTWKQARHDRRLAKELENVAEFARRCERDAKERS